MRKTRARMEHLSRTVDTGTTMWKQQKSIANEIATPPGAEVSMVDPEKTDAAGTKRKVKDYRR